MPGAWPRWPGSAAVGAGSAGVPIRRRAWGPTGWPGAGCPVASVIARKRKTDAAPLLDEADRTLYSTFCGAANSLSQLYTQAMAQQKLSFQAGERWWLRSDVIPYFQGWTPPESTARERDGGSPVRAQAPGGEGEGEEHVVEYDTDHGLDVLRFQIFSLTSVPPDLQKIVVEADGSVVDDGTDLEYISEGLRLVSIDEDEGDDAAAAEAARAQEKSDEELARMIQMQNVSRDYFSGVRICQS